MPAGFISSQVNCLEVRDEAQLLAQSFELTGFLMAWKGAQALGKSPLRDTIG